MRSFFQTATEGISHNQEKELKLKKNTVYP